jgi:LytS/YehU family sensor histidine kinase
VLRREGEFTTLGKELELVDAYLSIELARFEDRLRVQVDVPAHCRSVRVPSLLIQPLVENAIKHGIATSRAGGEVLIAARIVESPEARLLRVSVTDTSARTPRSARGRPWLRGVGLGSVERRLECHYGAAASLAIHPDRGAGTTVEVTLPAPLVEAGVQERRRS